MGSQDEPESITKEELPSSQGKDGYEPLVQDQSTAVSKLDELSGGTESSVASPAQAQIIEELKPLLAEEANPANEPGVESLDDGHLVVKDADVDALQRVVNDPVRGSDQAATNLDQEHVQPSSGSVVESVQSSESSGKGAPLEEREHNEALEPGQVEFQSLEADEPAKEAPKAQDEAPSAVEPEQPSGEAPSQGTEVDEQVENKVTEVLKEEPSPEQADAGESQGTDAAVSLDQSAGDKEAIGAQDEPEQSEADGLQGMEAAASHDQSGEQGDAEVIEAQESRAEPEAQELGAGVSHDQVATESQEEPPVAADVPPVPVAEESISTNREVAPEPVEDIDHKKAPEAEEVTAAMQPVPEAQDLVESVQKEDTTSTLEPQEEAPPSVEPRQPEADRGQGTEADDQEVVEALQAPFSMEPVHVQPEADAATSHVQAAEEGDKGTEAQEETPIDVGVEGTDRHLEVGPDAAERTEDKEVPEAAAPEAQKETTAALEPGVLDGTNADQSAEQGDKEVIKVREAEAEAEEHKEEHHDVEADTSNDQAAEQSDKGTKAQEEPPVAAEVPPVAVVESNFKDLERLGTVEETEHNEAPEAPEEASAIVDPVFAAQVEATAMVESAPEAEQKASAAAEPAVGEGTPSALESQEETSSAMEPGSISHGEQDDKGNEEPPVATEVLPVHELESTNRDFAPGPVEETEDKEPKVQEETTAPTEAEPNEETTSAVKPQEEAASAVELGQTKADGAQGDDSAEQGDKEEAACSVEPEIEKHEEGEADISHNQAAEPGEKGIEEPPVALPVPVVEELESTDRNLPVAPGPVEETEHKEAPEAQEETPAAVKPEPKEETVEPQEEASFAVEPGIHAVEVEKEADQEPSVAAEVPVSSIESTTEKPEKQKEEPDIRETPEQGKDASDGTEAVVEAEKEPVTTDGIEHQGQVQENEPAASETGYRGPEPVLEAKVIESPPEEAASDIKEEASATREVAAEGESRREESLNQPDASETTEVIAQDVQTLEASPSDTRPVEADEKADEKETERSLEVPPAEEPGRKVDDKPAGSVEATEVSSTPEVTEVVPGSNEQVTEAESRGRKVSPEADPETEAGNKKVDEESAAQVHSAGEAALVGSTGQTKEAGAAKTSADNGSGQNAAALSSAGGGDTKEALAEERSEAQVPHITRGTPASSTAGGEQEAGAKLEEPEATFEDAEDLDEPRHSDDVLGAQNEGSKATNVDEKATEVPIKNASDVSDAGQEDSTGDEDEKPVQSSGGIVGGIVGAALKAIGFGKSTKPSKKKRMKLKKQMETMKLASN